MEQEPRAEPAPPARWGAPVQPPEGGQDAVPEAWLEGEHEAVTTEVDRLAEDYNLVSMLAMQGFSGPDYKVFVDVLAAYGIAVVSAWLRSRQIFAKCLARGYGGLPTAPDGALDDPDTVAGLTNETVAIALVKFRESVLLAGRWDYRRGASLRTYFVGQCLMRFANVYRNWHRLEVQRDIPVEDGLLQLAESRTAPPVEAIVVEQATVTDALLTIRDARVRTALVLGSAGYSQTEIADRLGVSAKAVERMLANERARMKKRAIA